MDISPESINQAWVNLEQAKRDLFTAAEKAIDAKIHLERNRLVALATGDIIGKNETERAASAYTLLATEYKALEEAEREERHSRLEFDLCTLEADKIKYFIRLGEIAEASAIRQEGMVLKEAQAAKRAVRDRKPSTRKAKAAPAPAPAPAGASEELLPPSTLAKLGALQEEEVPF